MKIKNTLMAAAAAQLLLVGSVYAQTCTPTAGALSSGQNITIDTCTSTDQLATLCNSSTPIGAATDTIYSAQIGATASGNLVITPTYDAYAALLQGTCSGGATCAAESDNPGTAAESLTLTGRPAGAYFLLITSFTAPGPGSCGSTQIQVPTLPVTLQNFSVN